MSPPTPPARTDTLEQTLGFEGFAFDGESRASARMPVIDAIKQPFGFVHGGAYAALAESLCSGATYEAVGPDEIALGQSNDTTFLRPISAGVVEAVATVRHRGRTSWVWDVELSDDEGRLCAISRMIVAIRPTDRQGQPS